MSNTPCYTCRCLGSRRSRSQSPSRFIDSTASIIARPGSRDAHQPRQNDDRGYRQGAAAGGNVWLDFSTNSNVICGGGIGNANGAGDARCAGRLSCVNPRHLRQPPGAGKQLSRQCRTGGAVWTRVPLHLPMLLHPPGQVFIHTRRGVIIPLPTRMIAEPWRARPHRHRRQQEMVTSAARILPPAPAPTARNGGETGRSRRRAVPLRLGISRRRSPKSRAPTSRTSRRRPRPSRPRHHHHPKNDAGSDGSVGPLLWR